MAEGNKIALYSGPQGINVPKGAASSGYGRRGSTTGTTEKGALTMANFFDKIDKNTKLPDNIVASDKNMKMYHQVRYNAESLHQNFKSDYLMIAMTYGGDSKQFVVDHGADMSQRLAEIKQVENEALRIKSLGEQDWTALENSELSTMPQGTLVRNSKGYLMKIDEILSESGKLQLFKDDPTYAQYAWGMINTDGKPILDNSKFHKDLTIKELNGYIKLATQEPSAVTKEARIALQDYKPLASGWDDVTFINEEAEYDKIRKGVEGLGSYDDGLGEADTKEVSLYMDQVFSTGYKTDANTRRWINKNAEELAIEDSERLNYASSARETQELVKSFETLKMANDAIDGVGFMGFLLDPQLMMNKVDASSLPDEEKEKVRRLLSNQDAMRRALLHNNQDGTIIPQRYMSAMYKNSFKKELVEQYDTEKIKSTTTTNQILTQRKIQDASQGDFSRYEEVDTYVKNVASETSIIDVFDEQKDFSNESGDRSAFEMMLDGDWDKSGSVSESGLESYPEALVAHTNDIRGGKDPITLYGFSAVEKKFTPKANYPGGYEIKRGKHMIYDPVSGKTIPSPISGRVLEETMFTDNLIVYDKDDNSIDANIYVATKIALTKEEMQNYQVSRKGADPLMAEEIFAYKKNSIFWLNSQGHDEAAKRWMAWYNGNDRGLTEDKIQKFSEDVYMVTVFVQYNQQQYFDEMESMVMGKTKTDIKEGDIPIAKNAANSQLQMPTN